MPRKFPILLVAAALAAMPAAAATAQTPSPAPGQTAPEHGRRHDMQQRRMRGPMPGSVDMLLRHRTELKLSDDQIRRLEAIRSNYEAKNSPLLAQLRQAWAERPDSMRRGAMSPERRGAMRDSLRAMTPEQRNAMRDSMRQRREEFRKQHPEVEKAMTQLRENRQAERKEALAVLTPEQKQSLEQRMKERRGEWRERRDAERRDSAHRDGAR